MNKVFSLLPKDHIKIADDHGALSVARSGQVQLRATRDVNIALYSRTLRADVVIDAFLKCRDGEKDPKERALALKDVLRQLSIHHSFTLVLFDRTSRAFAASTRQSAPLAFTHDIDGTVILTCSLPRSRTPINSAPGSPPKLVHLPAGRFIYGNRYLRPCEFTAFWGSANASRAGAPVQHFDSTTTEHSVKSPAEGNSWRDPTPVIRDVQTHRKWRWTKDASSECDRVDSWRKNPASAPAAAAIPAQKPMVQKRQQPEMPQALRDLAGLVFCEGAAIGTLMQYATNPGTKGALAAATMSPAKRFLTLFVMRTATKLARAVRGAATEAMLDEIDHAQSEKAAPVRGAAVAASAQLRRVKSERATLLREDSQRQLLTVLEETEAKKSNVVASHVLKAASYSSSMLRTFTSSNLACQTSGTCCYNGVCYI